MSLVNRIVIVLVAFIAVLLLAVLALTRDLPAAKVLGEEKFAQRDNAQLQYFVSGPANGEAVVLQASYARSGADFNQLSATLAAAGYRTVIMQARGVDDSSLPSYDLTLFDYADDLEAVLQAEGLDAPVALVGHAFGNRIIRAYAARYPERVRALALLAAGDGSPPDEVRDAIGRVLMTGLPASVRQPAAQLAFFAPGNTVPDSWVQGWYPRAGFAQGRAVAALDAEQWIHAGGVDMLVVQPEKDAAAADGAAKLRQRFPAQVTIASVANAGHALLPEQPAAVARIVLQYLASR